MFQVEISCVQTNLDSDTDEEILKKIESKSVAVHQLEKKLSNLTRAVKLR